MTAAPRCPAWSIALPAALAIACSVPHMEESSHATFAAAAAAGAVAQGWVPDLVPRDAIDIREIHDLDTEEVWLRFTVPPEAIAGLVRPCREVDPLHVAYPRGTRGLSWWPEEMKRAAATPSTPYRFFRCPAPNRYPGQPYSMPTFLALSDHERSVWYWRRP